MSWRWLPFRPACLGWSAVLPRSLPGPSPSGSFLKDPRLPQPFAVQGRCNTGGFGHVRAGDQHRRAAHGFSSASVSGTGTRNDEIRRRQQLGILLMYSVTTRFSPGAKPFSFSRFSNSLTPRLPVACRCNVCWFVCFSQAQRSATTWLMRSAPAAAKAQNDRAVACVQFCAGCGAVAVRTSGEPGCPQRWFSRRPQLFYGIGAGSQNDVDLLRQQLVCHAGEGVLLMDGSLDAAFGRRAHNRPLT